MAKRQPRSAAIVSTPKPEAAPVAAPAVPDPLTPPAWEPPAGHIVSDERTYHIAVDGVRYVHVGDAPDGRWVYRAD